MIVHCVNDDGKFHIREAVRCYEAGAYRAAIVSSYVAVCFDLIAKLRGLASGGDQVAIALIDSLDKLQEQRRKGNNQAIKGLLEFERNLLEEFRDKFEFFGHQEFEELSRLRADRNQCAHPTFSNDALPYTPVAELARLHIRSALVYVLSQPARHGKAALNSLRTIITSAYFPNLLKDAVARLRGTEIGNARETLIRAFTDDLVYGWSNPSHAYYAHPNVLLAISATVELHRSMVVPKLVIAIQKLVKDSTTQAVRCAAAIAIKVIEAGEQVDEATQVVLKAWLLRETSEHKGNAIKGALLVGWWRDSALIALDALSAEQLANVTAPPPEMITRAAQIYATSGTWGEANALAETLAKPLAEHFSYGDIVIVMRASSNGADLRGSHGFRDFINILYDKNQIDNEQLESLMDVHGLTSYKRSV